MQIHLKCTGGQGITLEGKLDTKDLSDDLAVRAKKILSAKNLKKTAKAPKNTFMVDAQHYELTIIPEGAQKGAPARFQFDESQADPDILELMDELLHLITIQKLKNKQQ